MHQLLRMARSITRDHHIQVVLQLEHYDQKLVEFAAELGYNAVTVPAKDVHRARQHIIETEHQQILG